MDVAQRNKGSVENSLSPRGIVEAQLESLLLKSYSKLQKYLLLNNNYDADSRFFPNFMSVKLY